MTAETKAPISLDEIIEHPEENGMTKIFNCDRCGEKLFCRPDFDPPSCMNCNPELWGKPE